MHSKPKIDFPLANARVHEVCGSGAYGFAAISMGYAAGQVLWIRESWRPEGLNPAGADRYCDPAKILLAQVRSQVEALAVAEEALRDTALSLVVVELSQAVDLTAGRRLQLAAQAGKTIGLCVISEGMGSNAAQTRWRCTPTFDRDTTQTDSTLMHWELIKNKSGTLCDWYVRWSPTKPNPADRLAVVSPPGQ
jgi:protein ImuA